MDLSSQNSQAGCAPDVEKLSPPMSISELQSLKERVAHLEGVVQGFDKRLQKIEEINRLVMENII